MPLVKIYYKKEMSNEAFSAINNSIHDSFMECFEIPEKDTFQIWLLFDGQNSSIDGQYFLSKGKKRTENFIYIDILCLQGRTVEQKKKLYYSITKQIAAKTIIAIEDICISIKEMPPENWSYGEGIAQVLMKEEKEK